VGHADGHLALGEDHAVHPDALQDPPVERRHGLGDDPGHPEILHEHDGEQAGLDVLPDGDDGHVHVLDASGPEGALVVGVELDGGPDEVGVLLDALRVGVDADDILPELGQRLGHGGAEAPQADHGKCLLLH